MPKKKNKDNFQVGTDVFKLTNKRSKELTKEYKHARIDTDTWTDLAKFLKFKNQGEDGFKIYMWATELEGQKFKEKLASMVEGRLEGGEVEITRRRPRKTTDEVNYIG